MSADSATRISSGRLAAFSIMALVVVLAPIPLGSNRAWAVGILEASVFLVGMALVFATGDGRNTRSPAAYLLLVFLLFCVVQVIPLPSGLLSDAPWATHPESAIAVARKSISYDRLSSFEETIKWLMYSVAFLIATRARTGPPVEILLWGVFASGVINAVYGISNVLAEGLLEVGTYTAWHQGVAGTFANRNHFAGFMLLAIGAGLALLFRRESFRPGSYMRRPFGKVEWGIVGALGVLGAALVMSGSRGGVLSFLAAVMIVAWLGRGVLLNRGVRRAGAILLAVLVGFATVAAVDGWLLERFSESALFASRVPVWRDSLSVFFDHWVFGIGGGAFPDVFQYYKQADLSTKRYDHAHNDYLEFVVEYGLIGATPLLLFFMVTYRRLVARVDASSYESIRQGAGLLLGVTAFLIHGFGDFNMQIPANMLTFMVLLGLGVGHHLGSSSVKCGGECSGG